MLANFTIEVVDGVICLEDLNDVATIEGDAAAVVSNLKERGHVVDQTAIIFRDPAGDWATLLTLAGAVCVAPLASADPRDRDEALALVKAAWRHGNPLGAVRG